MRRECRAKRRALLPREQGIHARAACRTLLGIGVLRAQRRVSAYFAIDGELDPEPLCARMHEMNLEVVFPVIGKRREQRVMHFRRLTPGQNLELNRVGIWEPANSQRPVPGWSVSMMLVPLVAFDALGTRLGMGGGYYDAYLARLGPRRPLLVGYAHECQRVESIPRAPWDVPLDAVATERAIYLISKRAKRFNQEST